MKYRLIEVTLGDMPSEKFNELLATITRVQKLVWAAFAASVVFYVAVAYMSIGVIAHDTVATSSAAVARGASFAAAAAFFAAVILRRILFSDARVEAVLAAADGEADETGAAGAASEKPRGGVRRTVARGTDDGIALGDELSPAELSALKLASWCTSQFVILWAVAESVAIMGMLRSLLTGDLYDMTPMVFGTFILLAISFPDIDPFVQRVMVHRDRAPGF